MARMKPQAMVGKLYTNKRLLSPSFIWREIENGQFEEDWIHLKTFVVVGFFLKKELVFRLLTREGELVRILWSPYHEWIELKDTEGNS